MTHTFKNASVYENGMLRQRDISVSDGVIVDSSSVSVSTVEVDCHSYALLPGLVDVHVHLREPGFLYKENMKTGTMAAAHGGYTTVCTMPNLAPTPDCMEHLEVEMEAIRKDACVNVVPYGTITMGEKGQMLSDMEALAPHVVGFSDDGKGVQDEEMMRKAMEKAKSLSKLIVAHCEDESLLKGGYIHDGEYAKTHGHKGICSESEWGPIKRDIELVRQTGCGYHVCHISTKESVELIRQAKKEGLDVTCETAPHYLLMDDSMLQEDGRFKMNPPLRDKTDREALVAALVDGTIDMIATDHAPHSEEEKSRGLAGSPMGIVGLETAFPLMYTNFVKTGVITMERLMELMVEAPCRRFGLESSLQAGTRAGFTVYDLDAEYEIDPNEFLSKGRNTPFGGWSVAGKCLLTVADGKVVWNDGTLGLDAAEL